MYLIYLYPLGHANEFTHFYALVPLDYYWHNGLVTGAMKSEYYPLFFIMNNPAASADYVNNVIEERKASYQGEPTLILQDYNSEKGTTADYNGRQLLELLQNANDAARFGTPGSRRVLLQLDRSTLDVANTGERFTQKGIRSVLYSHLSPKPLDFDQIGSKGLGFRAMLNWVEGLEIHSGDLHVAFSATIAGEFLTSMRDTPKVKAVLDAYFHENPSAPLPVAVLRCPKLLDTVPNTLPFDTRIRLFLRDSQITAVEQQLQKEITAETMVFLPNIDELQVDINGQSSTWQRTILGTGASQQVRLRHVDEAGSILSEQTWQVEIERGYLPVEVLASDDVTADSDTPTPYELKVAWSAEDTLVPGMLYSYFRTSLSLPLPIRAHGTFDLSDNRQNLQKTEVNNWLLKRLGRLIVDAALQFTQRQPENPFLPLSLVWGGAATSWVFGSELDELGLGSSIKDALMQAPIFPVISGEYRQISQVMSYKEPFALFLHPESQNECLLRWPCKTAVPGSTDEELNLKALRQTIGLLKPMPGYEPNALLARIAAVRPTTPGADYITYAELLRLVEEHWRSSPTFSKLLAQSAAPLPVLFSDENGEGLNPEQGVFLPPDSSNSMRLPGLSVINSALAQCLRARFNVSSFRSLSGLLEPLKVLAYSFEQLAAQVIRSHSHQPEKLHPILFRLFQAEKRNTTTALPSPKLPVPVRSRARRQPVAFASIVYFGREYDGSDALCAALYAFDQNKLVAEPSALGLGKSKLEEVRAYLIWCGIAERPRWLVKDNGLEEDYKNHVLRRFNYRQTIDNSSFRNFSALKAKHAGFSTYKVWTIDGLREILTRNRPATILRWVRQDKALAATLDEDQEPQHSFLHIGNYNANRYLSADQMASYVRWQFATTPWLVVQGGDSPQAPQRTILPSRGQPVDDFSPLLYTPDLTKLETGKSSDKKKAFTSKQLVDLLPRLGVNKGLSELPTELLYQVLLELPERDNEGRRVKTLYHELASHYEQDSLDLEDPQRIAFLQGGKVWCSTPTGERYIALKDNQARYIAETTYGAQWTSRLVALAVEPRRGAKKIEQLFGVPPLGGLTFSVVGSPVTHPYTPDFERDWAHLLPYVYSLLPRTKTLEGKAEKLKALQMQLTTALVISHEDSEVDEHIATEALPVFGHLYLTSSTTAKPRAWVVAPGNLNLTALKSSVGFVDALSELLANLLEASDLRDSFYTYITLSSPQRDEKLKRDLGKVALETLKRAREALDLQLEPQQSFWTHLAPFLTPHYSGMLPSTDSGWHWWFAEELTPGPIQEQVRSLYDSLPAPVQWQAEELRQVFNLFQALGLTPADFNRTSLQAISFQPCLQQDFEGLILRFENSFGILLYERLAVATVKQQRHFQDMRQEFKLLQAPEPTINGTEAPEIFFAAVKRQFDIDLTTQPQHEGNFLSMLYETNLQELIVEAEKAGWPASYIAQTFLGSPVRQSLVYFGKIDTLAAELPVSPLKTKGPTDTTVQNSRTFDLGGQPLIYTDFKDLSSQLVKYWAKLDLKIRTLTTRSLPLVPDEEKPKGKRPWHVGPSLGKPERNSVVGAIGEWIAYKALQERYGEDKVKWVSENARLMGHEEGKDGEGFDLVYEDRQGRPRFVEVKASTVSQQRRFYISAAEVRKGEANRAAYDIMLVAGIQSMQGPTVELIKQPFSYARGDSFMQNDRFSVQEETFLVRFADAD